MQKDMQAFTLNPTYENAKKVLKHAGKISAQCFFFAEIAAAKKIVGV